MRLPRLILASASPRRVDLLRQSGFEFDIIPAEADEHHPHYLTPGEISLVNAHRKARSIARKYPDAVVIGADTIVCLDDFIFGKPADLAEAEQMLMQLQGRTHRVITGVCLFRYRPRRHRMFAVTTLVTFRPLELPQIRDYISKVNPLDKAGAYGIQEQRELIIENVLGSFSNVVGLPVEKVWEELRDWQT